MSAVRSPSGRRWARVAGLVVALAAVVWGGRELVGLMARETTRATLPVPDGIARFEVPDLPGELVIDGTDAGERRLEQTIRTALTSPDIATRTSGDTLIYTADCAWWDDFCDVSLRARVDRTLPVRASTSSGDIVIRNITGTVDADASSGDVRVEGGSGNLRLEASSGDIALVDSSAAAVTASTGSGDIDLRLTSPPRSVTVDVSSGDITVELPPGPDGYRVETDISSGESSIEVRTDPTSSRVIRLSASSGDVTVRYARP